jgi:nucleoside-diphosphate-sugar epimerase
MRVFLTGATGFIGSAISRDLIAAGHEVTGLARTAKAAQTLTAAGISVFRGSLSDLDSLKRAAAAADGVIHTAFVHSFSKLSMSNRLKILSGGSPTKIAERFLSLIAVLDQNAKGNG